MLRMQRAKQRVIVEPPGLLVRVRSEPRRAWRLAFPLVILKMRERAVQRHRLERPYRCIVHRRRRAYGCQTLAPFGRERAFTTNRGKVLHISQRDELRIDGHRAQRRVGRRFGDRHLVDRQHEQHALSGPRQPTAHRFEITDLANSPTACGRNREQRNEKPSAPRLRWQCHTLVYRSTRSNASSKTFSGGSRLNTRNASWAKSKKKPGCTRTRSRCRRPSASASSGRVAGTRNTTDQPPSVRSTSHPG